MPFGSKTDPSDPEVAPPIKDNSEPFKPKGKYPGFNKNLYDYFTEYSSNTGIHGFKYMGEQERSVLEK